MNMRINFLIILIFGLLRIDSGNAQLKDTIKGKVISSISFKRPKGNIYIIEKWNSNGTMADSLGNFTLIPLKEKSNYPIEISIGNYPKLEYVYKSDWTKRKNPKSIVIQGKCEITKETAKKDWKKEKAKLYIIGGIVPIENTRKDIKFERKFKVEYYDLGCNGKIYECLEDYNQYIFKLLDIKFNYKWRNLVRNDVVGIK